MCVWAWFWKSLWRKKVRQIIGNADDLENKWARWKLSQTHTVCSQTVPNMFRISLLGLLRTFYCRVLRSRWVLESLGRGFQIFTPKDFQVSIFCWGLLLVYLIFFRWVERDGELLVLQFSWGTIIWTPCPYVQYAVKLCAWKFSPILLLQHV